jgi:hypothetical protein
MAKTYLGDGVYVDFDHGAIKLTAENGVEATATIYLEFEVFYALLKHLNKEAMAAKVADSDAVAVLKEIMKDGCCCEMLVNNPMVHKHSDVCLRAQKVLAALKG